jgi:hypothetical protein
MFNLLCSNWYVYLHNSLNSVYADKDKLRQKSDKFIFLNILIIGILFLTNTNPPT